MDHELGTIDMGTAFVPSIMSRRRLRVLIYVLATLSAGIIDTFKWIRSNGRLSLFDVFSAPTLGQATHILKHYDAFSRVAREH